MKKISFTLLTMYSFTTFSATQLVCNSANYSLNVILKEDRSPYNIEFLINNNQSTSMLSVVDSYASNKFIALNIENVTTKSGIEVLANLKSKNWYQGLIWVGKTKQLVNCSKSYVVIAPERDDDFDQNL